MLYATTFPFGEVYQIDPDSGKIIWQNTVAGKHVVLRWILNEIWFGVVPIMAFSF